MIDEKIKLLYYICVYIYILKIEIKIQFKFQVFESVLFNIIY